MKKKSGKVPEKRSRTLWPRDGEEFVGNLGDKMIYGQPMKLKEKGPHPQKIPYAEVNMEPMTMADFKKKHPDSWKMAEENKRKD
jgi:hypothetical protein